MSLCLRRRGKILLNRSIGYAQGNSPDGLAGRCENWHT